MARTASWNYGRKHRAARAHLRPIVEAGEAECTELICLEPDRWIQPGTPWDLAHDRAAGPGRYLGPAHAGCNRSEGATWGNLQRHPAPDPEPEPTGWTL